MRVGGFNVANVYKPQSERWEIGNILPILPHPAVFVGDFNSHHPDWGYADPDLEGKKLQNLAPSMTLSSEVPSVQPAGSENTRPTCAGYQRWLDTLSLPRVWSWMTFPKVSTDPPLFMLA